MSIEFKTPTAEQVSAMQEFADLVGSALDYITKYENCQEISICGVKLRESMHWMHNAILSGVKLAEEKKENE